MLSVGVTHRGRSLSEVEIVSISGVVLQSNVDRQNDNSKCSDEIVHIVDKKDAVHLDSNILVDTFCLKVNVIYIC